MAESNDNLNYLLLTLASAEEFKPDYHRLAALTGISNANTAQKKFKKIVEGAGFSLTKGAVVMPEDQNAPTPTTPRTKKTTAATTPASKKRKIAAKDEEQEDGNGTGTADPVKAEG